MNPTGTVRLSHGGKILTVTTNAKRGKRGKRGKRTVPKVVVYAVEKTLEGVVYLTKENGERYRLAGGSCSCPDRQFRPGSVCKHVLACRAAGLMPKE